MAVDKIKINGVTEDIDARKAQYALSLSNDAGDAVFHTYNTIASYQNCFSITDSEGFEKVTLAWGAEVHACNGLTLYNDASDESTDRAKIQLRFMDEASCIMLYDKQGSTTEIRSTKIIMPNHATLQADPTDGNSWKSRLEIHSGNNTTPGYTKIILGGHTGTYGSQDAEFFFKDKGFLLNRDIWIKDPNDDIAGDSAYDKLVLNTGAQTLDSTQQSQVRTNIDAAKTSHASSDTTYGQATTSNYGHVKLSNTTLNASSTGSSGIACSTGHKHSQYVEVSSWDATYGNLVIKINN